MNVGQTLLDALKHYGARALFGIPGDYILPFFDIIEHEKKIPLYTFSHEPAVGYAADAAARHGKGIGVAVVTYGAGALNLLNAAACAWAEHSPLVVISGAPGRGEFDRDLLLHHQVKDAGSQLRIFQEVTCASAVLQSPATAPEDIARVLDACVHFSRPVYIELPRDCVTASCATFSWSPSTRLHAAGQDDCLRAVQARIEAAKSPVILADVEIRRFDLENDIAAFSRETGIPLVTTLMGKGMFAGDPACRGTYMGQAGDCAIAQMVENSDCLLMLGVIASDTNLGAAGRTISLQDAIRVNDGCIVMGTDRFENIRLRNFIGELGKNLVNRTASLPCVVQKDEAPAPETPLSANHIAVAVNNQMGGAHLMPVAVDVGDCLFVGTHIRNAPLLASAYYVTMGFGVPAGMGVQAATGERALVMTGDGGFQMTGWELLNAARNGLDPIVVVLNNRGWGMLEQFSPGAGYTACGDVCYADIARVLGGDGYKAVTYGELAESFATAFSKRGKFQLIEAVLPKGEISSTLKNFVRALKDKK